MKYEDSVETSEVFCTLFKKSRQPHKTGAKKRLGDGGFMELAE
ncbi:protein of unknown function [Methylocaldum szegediense]|uniref:Transposase n=1 Tax=Methylocaldum szegediense TaxID=73780 RepID=A0ABN8WZW6_9GAMM|nr:protein of unknown function [Methylocaldum szegediense]